MSFDFDRTETQKCPFVCSFGIKKCNIHNRHKVYFFIPIAFNSFKIISIFLLKWS